MARRAALLSALALGLALAAAPAGAEPSRQPGDPPLACAGSTWADRVGGEGADRIAADPQPERVWGLGGDDVLTGSAGRASCLMGGAGDDTLQLSGGGGVAWGEAGADTLEGSPLADELDGGSGTDGFRAGAGDDQIVSRDGHPEVVDCGPGDDVVDADRSDVLIGCEVQLTGGRPLATVQVRPSVARTTSTTVRARLRAPRAGSYRVLLLPREHAGHCASGAHDVARFHARRPRHVRVALHAPRHGWCSGVEQAAVLRQPSHDRPAEPVARLRFRAG
jgi:Ca2+-binding RTX toxin-like protein